MVEDDSEKYEITIYVLKLENGYFYVGKTRNFEVRYKQHANLKGAEWTKLHKVVGELKVFCFKVSTQREEDQMENEVTLSMMRFRGWQKVRGGDYSSVGDYATLKTLNNRGHFLDQNADEVAYAPSSLTIYVIRLESDKYFVGYTRNLKRAFKKHQKGKASSWTRRYKPIEVIETIAVQCETGKQSVPMTNEVVLRYFDKFGVKNVRGGSFVVPEDEKHVLFVNKKE